MSITEDMKLALGRPVTYPEPLPIVAAEGISGVWHYHLRHPAGGQALCGAVVMQCPLPLEDWGFRGHLNESYCDDCREAVRS